MDKYDKVFYSLTGTIMAFLLIMLFSSIFISPIYEKKHYTKLTGIEVSYFDALFLDLNPSKHVVQIDEKE